MNKKKYLYTLTENERAAVRYAIDYFFESAPYILHEGIFPQEKEEKEGFQAIVATLEALVERMGGGASE